MGVPDVPLRPTHEIALERRARFLLPVCSCGWIGTARLVASSARAEARDHALLYAGLDLREPGPDGSTGASPGREEDADITASDAGDPAGPGRGE